MQTTPGTKQPDWLAELRKPACYPHPVDRVEVLETHISWVFLAGEYAYKVKKPVNLGFLDFSTLAARRFYCTEELRLNRRLAPGLYLDVVGIGGRPLRIGGPGPAIEYAVKMRRFAQDALLERVLARGELDAQRIESFAATLAAFHREAPVAREGSPLGSPERILGAALENFEQLRERLNEPGELAALESLRTWTLREHRLRAGEFAQRKQRGFVRECHGDLHLGNIALVEGQLTPFDCIEFNEDLRWIDVLSEVAFLTMDLQAHGRPDLGWRFLNAWLEITGDYAGLAVLRYYLVYRALVRAKVAGIRAVDARASAQDRARTQCRSYLELAERYTRPSRPALIVNHGLSGSGKTTRSAAMLEALRAVRLRSDVERKRLHRLEPLARSGSAKGAGIYDEQTTRSTYRRLAELARSVLGAGFPVIVDAAFLQRWQRDGFHRLADELGVAFAIVDYRAAEATLRKRVAQREAGLQDASEADLEVFEHQLAIYQPLDPDEQPWALVIDTERSQVAQDWSELARRLERLD